MSREVHVRFWEGVPPALLNYLNEYSGALAAVSV